MALPVNFCGDTLSRLAAIGLIERKYKSIIVPDMPKLREFLAQEEI